jgi:hypothetical protein
MITGTLHEAELTTRKFLQRRYQLFRMCRIDLEGTYVRTIIFLLCNVAI